MALAAFDPTIPVCVSGDDWHEHGGLGYDGNSEGGWEATRIIFQYLDQFVIRPSGAPGPEFVSIGSKNPIVAYLESELGYPVRTALTYEECMAVFREMQEGTYWPRLMYFGGTDGSDDWGYYPGARSAVIGSIDFLRQWFTLKKTGLFSHYDYSYNQWLGALYSGQLLSYYDGWAGGQLEATGMAVGHPILGALQGYAPTGTPRPVNLTTPWHGNFAVHREIHADFMLNNVIVQTSEPHVPVTVLGLPPMREMLTGGKLVEGRWFARMVGGPR